jgi:hypothetical protein
MSISSTGAAVRSRSAALVADRAGNGDGAGKCIRPRVGGGGGDGLRER